VGPQRYVAFTTVMPRFYCHYPTLYHILCGCTSVTLAILLLAIPDGSSAALCALS
jgi:hypothetical protein